MKLLCIEDVIMKTEDQYKAFTKGKVYKAWKGHVKEYYDLKPVLRTRNDKNEQHLVRYLKEDRLELFFNTHFIEIKG